MSLAGTLGRSVAGRREPAWRAPALWGGIAAFPVVVGLMSLGIGRYPVPIDQVLLALAAGSGFAVDVPGTVERVVLLIRLPRILEGLVIGGGLALAGAALQGVFRNPLVGPQIIGVSSGAAFGGALALLLGLGLAGLMAGAFVFGITALVIVFALSRIDGRSPVLMLVLAGVVTGAFFAALVSLVTFLADPNDTLPAIVYWLMGSFATASWPKVGLVTGVTAVAAAVLMAMRFRINVLSLGDEDAQALGIAVEPTRWAILVAATALVAGSVAVAGIIGWVGLVVPHIARMLVGPDHRRLLPAAALLGAGYMVLVDNVARTATASEIPLGVLTAIIGAPMFAWLLRRTQAGGWT